MEIMKSILPDKYFFNLSEVAKIFNVHVTTVYRWIEDQRLKATPMPSGKKKISRQELQKFIDLIDFEQK